MITTKLYEKDTFTQRQAFEKDYKLRVRKLLQELNPGRLIREASSHEDRKLATDWVVEADNLSCIINIASRGRDYKEAYRNYLGQFTIRLGYPNAYIVTEYAKIMEGNGDQFLYYWRDKAAGGHLVLWHLLDLNVFRKEAEKVISDRRIKPQQNSRLKGGESFYPFNFDYFSKELVLAKYDMAQPPY
jgi:hypothetical protein